MWYKYADIEHKSMDTFELIREFVDYGYVVHTSTKIDNGKYKLQSLNYGYRRTVLTYFLKVFHIACFSEIADFSEIVFISYHTISYSIISM